MSLSLPKLSPSLLYFPNIALSAIWSGQLLFLVECLTGTPCNNQHFSLLDWLYQNIYRYFDLILPSDNYKMTGGWEKEKTGFHYGDFKPPGGGAQFCFSTAGSATFGDTRWARLIIQLKNPVMRTKQHAEYVPGHFWRNLWTFFRNQSVKGYSSKFCYDIVRIRLKWIPILSYWYPK